MRERILDGRKINDYYLSRIILHPKPSMDEIKRSSGEAKKRQDIGLRYAKNSVTTKLSLPSPTWRRRRYEFIAIFPEKHI